jgi:hypothetical protein
VNDDLSPAQRRILDAAERLTYRGSFTYDRPRGDDTPMPTCAGCGASAWNEITHYANCTVEELIAAVRALKE